MKSLILMLSLVVSVSAQASETFFQCYLSAKSKSSGSDIERTIILSNKRTSKTTLHDPWNTELNLISSSDAEKISGTVNGQRNFILKPGKNGTTVFESASATGVIDCEVLGSMEAFIFKPHGAIYVTQLKSVNHLNSASSLPLSCYIGDVQSAKDAVVQTLVGKSDVKDVTIDASENIVATAMVTDCLESRGSYDDYECLKRSKPYLKAYKMSTCDPEPQDPR